MHQLSYDVTFQHHLGTRRYGITGFTMAESICSSFTIKMTLALRLGQPQRS